MAKLLLVLYITILYLSFNLVHCIWPEFYLFTRVKPNGVYLNYGSTMRLSLQYEIFGRRQWSFFVIHGYNNNGNASWVVDTKNQLLTKYDANVFIVNWSEGAAGIDYFSVAANVQPCGARIGAFIIQNKIPACRTHCIGHSLGAHVCGFLGKNLKSQNLLLSRITGLDPAGPNFGGLSQTRLDRADANYTDVIHTNAGTYGLASAIGHKDFYPNGGSSQPGCPWLDFTCSHQRSTLFFIESINSNCQFTSSYCGAVYGSSCNGPNGFMGLYSTKTNDVGSFSLTTNAGSPYCRG